jgi:hypothetical protein
MVSYNCLFYRTAGFAKLSTGIAYYCFIRGLDFRKKHKTAFLRQFLRFLRQIIFYRTTVSKRKLARLGLGYGQFHKMPPVD